MYRLITKEKKALAIRSKNWERQQTLSREHEAGFESQSGYQPKTAADKIIGKARRRLIDSGFAISAGRHRKRVKNKECLKISQTTNRFNATENSTKTLKANLLKSLRNKSTKSKKELRVKNKNE